MRLGWSSEHTIIEGYIDHAQIVRTHVMLWWCLSLCLCNVNLLETFSTSFTMASDSPMPRKKISTREGCTALAQEGFLAGVFASNCQQLGPKSRTRSRIVELLTCAEMARQMLGTFKRP